jgi:hypothetical protein
VTSIAWAGRAILKKACRKRATLVVTGLSLALGPALGCENTLEPDDSPELLTTEVGVVVNSVDISLTVFPVDSPSTAVTIGLGPDGSPVGLSTRGNLAVVPMGIVPALAVVDLAEGRLSKTIPLPAGSGATGSHFLNDSVAVVANSNRNSVTAGDLRRGTTGGGIPVGGFPQGIHATDAGVLVMNGELGSDFLPKSPATVTVLHRETLAPLRTLPLSGLNAASAISGPNGRIYVINQGRLFGNDGSLSVLDPGVLGEIEHYPGFGDFPGSSAIGSDGRLYVSSFSYGVAVWDPSTGEFDRSPENAIRPGGIPSASGLAFGPSGRLYTLSPECQRPSVVNRLGPGFEVEETIPVGTCPIALAFTTLTRTANGSR